MGEQGSDGGKALEATEIVPPARTIVGKYRLGRLIGEGGMGTVYEAEHTGLGIKVAIKLLGESFSEDHVFVKRFRREARASAAVRHENVVTIMDTGTDEDGVPFLVMELLDGESLSSLVRREKVLAPEMACAIARQILRGLGAAHRQSVVHRDLKPANVFLAELSDGTVKAKILDFGISKFVGEHRSHDVTAEGAVIGTPSYMAPEQVRGQSDVDARADLYAVAVMIYRMTTGKLPFTGKKSRQIYDRILTGELVPPRAIKSTIPEALEAVILRAMAGERGDRFPTAEAMIAALEEAVPHSDRVEALPLLTRSSVAPAGTAPTVPSHTARRRSTDAPMHDEVEEVSGERLPRTREDRASGGPVALPARDTGTSRAAPTDARTTARPTSQRERARSAALWPGLVAAVCVVGVVGWLAGGGENTQGAGPPASDGATGGAAGEAPAPVGGETPGASAAGAHRGPPLVYAVVRYGPVSGVRDTHEPLAAFLSERLHRSVELRVLEEYELDDQLRGEAETLVALSAVRYVQARERDASMTLLATAEGPGGPSYQGIIVASSESDLSSVDALRGSTFCFVSPTSASGYVYPRALLRHRGLDPERDLQAVLTGDHMRSLMGVTDGTCRAAAVFQGIFQEPRAPDSRRFTILDQTPRIPHDAYVATERVPEQTRHDLRAALLSLARGSELATRIFGDGALRGFVPGDDDAYQAARDILRNVDESGR